MYALPCSPQAGQTACSPHTFPRDSLERYRAALTECEYAPATVEKYIQIVQCFCAALANEPVSKEAVLAYKKSLLEKYAAASVNGMLAAINSYLHFMGWHECRVKPVKVQRAACRDEKRELTREEYCRLLEAARAAGQARLYHLIQTIGSTGIRVSEVKYITVEAVRSGRAEVRNKGKTRVIFLPKTLCARLKAYCRKHRIKSGSVFVTRGGKPLDRSNIWAMMKRLCSAAKVEASKVFPHNLRHLFARLFYEQQHDLDHLAVILGHSNINTTRIYTQTSEAEYQKQVETLHLLL